MAVPAVTFIKDRWSIFCYNFHWADYSGLFTGNLARVSAFVPLLGYLIIFNDGISQHLTFEKLAPKSAEITFFSGQMRLRLIYFGLIFLGVAELIYLMRRPQVMKLGKDFFSYKEKILSLASPSLFREIHYDIKGCGFDPFTRGGKYYDRDFDDFMEISTGAKPGNSVKEAYENGRSANWEEARRRFEPLLTGMLEENYFKQGRKRLISLSCAIVFAGIGYVLLIIPSLELFVRVVAATL